MRANLYHALTKADYDRLMEGRDTTLTHDGIRPVVRADAATMAARAAALPVQKPPRSYKRPSRAELRARKAERGEAA